MKRIITVFSAVMFLCTSCATVADVQVARYRDGKAAAVSFTYDDGSREHYSMVAPELEKNGLRGTFWVCGSFVTGMTPEEMADLTVRGHEVSNHSWSHPKLNELSDEELAREVCDNDDFIEKATGVRPVTFAYPFNAVDRRVLAFCGKDRVGTRLRCTGHGQDKRHTTYADMVKWFEGLVADGEWGITMTHGITRGYDHWNNPQELWDFFAYVAEHKDVVWVGLFKEVAAYTAERDACRLTVEKRGRKTIVTPECGLDRDLFCEPLTLEVTMSNGRKVYMTFDPYGGSFKVLKR